jgi:anti-sigma regulatory factor (Ser/Thr protein kinase)
MNTTPLPARATGQGTPDLLITLPGVPESASQARALTSAALAGTGCPAVDEILLIVTEFASNAILHSRSRRPGGGFALCLTVTPSESVLIQVRDEGPDPARFPPARLANGELPESGRGLGLVARLSAEWGRDGSGLSWALVRWHASLSPP